MDRGSVSLIFRHPARDLRFLRDVLSLVPFQTWAVGEPLRALSGEILTGELKGTYEDSYWVARLEFEPKDGFGVQLDRTVSRLKRIETTVQDHIESGGTVEIYLDLTGHTHNAGKMPAPLLATMAELGITLWVEVFPK
ncbi:MAG: hypothetical protein AB7O88_27215 [Reyranellaceae bacterium]